MDESTQSSRSLRIAGVPYLRFGATALLGGLVAAGVLLAFVYFLAAGGLLPPELSGGRMAKSVALLIGPGRGLLSLAVLGGMISGFQLTRWGAGFTRLRRKCSRLKTAVSFLEDAVFFLEGNGAILDLNPAAGEFLRLGSEGIAGRIFPDCLPGGSGSCQSGDGNPCALTSHQHPENMVRCTHQVDDGSVTRLLDATSRRLRGADGQGRGRVVQIRNVTAEKALEGHVRELEEKRDNDRKNRKKFLSGMGQELRAPINGIVGMLELTLETDLSGEQKEYINTARQSTETLLRVLNRMLDFSRIRANRPVMESIDFDLRTSVESTVETLAVQAHRKNLELLCHVKPEAPHRLKGDPGRLRQALVNLVTNAIDSTEEGEILVTVQPASDADSETNAPDEKGSPPDNHLLHFTVSDTSGGLFSPATRQNRSPRATADGDKEEPDAASGLAVAGEIVELLGGRMWAESERGRGSVFHFTASFEPGRHKPETVTVATEIVPEETRVFIVDDNERSREILNEMVENWGFLTEKSESGPDARRQLEAKRDEGTKIDLIVVDLHMPDMDGFELARTIRADLGNEAPRIILLVSAGLRGDVDRCREVGIHAYLHKPVRHADLREAIQRTLSADPASDQVITRYTLKEERVFLHVLITEGADAAQQDHLVRMLEKQGHLVEVAPDEKSAAGSLQDQHYDLALVDVAAPTVKAKAVQNGKGETKILKRDTPLPLVALTARALQNQRSRAV